MPAHECCALHGRSRVPSPLRQEGCGFKLSNKTITALTGTSRRCEPKSCVIALGVYVLVDKNVAQEQTSNQELVPNR